MNVHQKIINRGIANPLLDQADQYIGEPESSTDVRTAYSHPQPISNESTFVTKQFDQVSQYNSTANIRLTSTIFPKSRAVAGDCCIPLAAVIQPYGQSVYDGFPSTSYGSNPIVRCEQCKAYMNPFMTFPRSGQDLKCNMCGWQAPLAQHYICEVDRTTGARLDQFDKHELHLGSFDIKAGQEYQARPPMPPTYFFMIDTSKATLDLGIIKLFSDTLKTLITENQLQGQNRTMFGILTYDTTIQLYNLKPSLKTPQIFTLTDLSEVNLPVPGEFFVNLEESRDLILYLLEQFQNFFQNTKIQLATCFSKALEVAKVLMGHYGGKLIIVSASSSISQDTALQPQIQQQPKSYLLPSSPALATMSDEMHLQFICPSVFIFSKSYANVITVAELTKYLNGDLYYYNSQDDSVQKQFFYQLKSILTKDYTWESVFRLRVSRGFRITQTLGNYSIKSNDLLNLTCMDDYKSLMLEFDIEGSMCNYETLYLQSALLYTSKTGERRIRVHNYAIPLTVDAALIQRHADSSVIATYMTKKTLYQLYKNPSINDLRSKLLQQTKNIIKSSLKLSKVVHQNSYQTLPNSLDSLIMNVLGLLKHPIFTTNYTSSIKTDSTNALRSQLIFFNTDETMINIVPYLFRIDDLTENNCYYADDGQFVYPEVIAVIKKQLLSLGLQTIQQGGIFLMDLGGLMIIYLSKDYDENLAQDIFGIHYVTNLLVEDMLYSNSHNPINTCLYYLIMALRSRKYTGYAPLLIVKAGDNSTTLHEQLFLKSLILDDVYADYKMKYESFYQLIIE